MVLILGLGFAFVLLQKSTLSFSLVDLATISCSLVNFSVLDTIHIIISSCILWIWLILLGVDLYF